MGTEAVAMGGVKPLWTSNSCDRSSSGLTGSCINGRDVCNKSSLSSIWNMKNHGPVSVLTRQKIGRGYGE